MASSRVRYTFLLLVSLGPLSACASVIGQGALSPPMLNLDILQDDQLEAIGYRTQEHCSQQDYVSLDMAYRPLETLCMSYMMADYYDAPRFAHWQQQATLWAQQAPLNTRAMEVRLRYWPGEATVISPLGKGSGVVGNDNAVPEPKYEGGGRTGDVLDYVIELNTTRGDDLVGMRMQREDAYTHQGTYLLIHGFRTNKESLFFIAEALRFHGHNVVLVDLFGHGDSSGRFSFSGEPDAIVISELIDSLQIQGPLHVLGMSMGGTTSIHLAMRRDDIRSVTLLAPMWEFVDAFVDAGRAYTRTAHLVPQSQLQRGAEYALAEAGTDAADTAVVQRLGSLDIPVLVMASADDRISPLAKLKTLANDQVTVHEVAPRTHHGMILWDSEDVKVWHRWLQRQ